jgi:hypothetical protein
MRIMCAQCGWPVDRVQTWIEPGDMGVRIKAYCHGEEDAMRLGLRDMDQLGRDGLRQIEDGEGMAFATPRIAVSRG